MASTILTNWTVYYADDAAAENGMKQIKWSGGSTGSNTLNELYSALMHLFDNAGNNDADDSIPLVAVTPTLYEIGSSDAGDREPWFIDPESAKHLTGGGLNTSNWTRDTSARTGSKGIVKITRSGANIVAGDIGATITNTTNGDSGWLLHLESDTLWIRPDSSAAEDDWDSASGTITCNGHSDTQTGAAVTAESIWSNIFSLGTLEAETEIYVNQNFTPLTQWWNTGHIDILVLTTDFGTLIDDGLVTVFARQYTKLYDHFQIDVSGGGRSPVPLATAADSNNITGYYTINGSSGTSDFDVGNYIYVGASWNTASKKGVVTAVAGTVTDPDIEYYLLGSLTNFAPPEVLKEYNPATSSDGDGTCTVDTVTASGPAASPSSTLTIGFAGISRDLDNGNGFRPYSTELDLQGTISLLQLYQRLKYLTGQGQTSDIDTQTSQALIGQSYLSVGDYYIPYDTGSVDNPFTEGEIITGPDNFTATLTSKHDRGTNEGFLIVRNVRGLLPVNNSTLTGTSSFHTALVDTDAGADPVAAIAPVKQSPFGTFAGGKFFGARGVWLANVPGTYANNYELIDSEGQRQTPPSTVAITVNNTQAGDRVSVFRTTGTGLETIDKDVFTINTNQGGSGASHIRVDETIPADTPSSGSVRVVIRDASNNITADDRYTYSSWSNANQPAYSEFTLTGTTDSAYDTTDTAYVPYIDIQASSTSVSQSVTYVADRPILIRVRIGGMIPFTVTDTLDDDGVSVTTIRTTDANYTP